MVLNNTEVNVICSGVILFAFFFYYLWKLFLFSVIIIVMMVFALDWVERNVLNAFVYVEYWTITKCFV